MARGRPSKYSPEILEQAQAYLDGGYEAEEPVPTIAGLADTLKISRDTVYDWASQEDKQEFSDTVEGILVRQERKLLSGGLKGDHNPTIAKLMLNNHGYSDKVENTHQGPGGGPVTWEVQGVDSAG